MRLRANPLLVALALAALPAAWCASSVFGLRVVLWQPQWLAALWVLVAAPVLEETALRLLLQKGLGGRLRGFTSRAPSWALQLNGREGHAANLLVALVFVLMHAPAHGWASVLWVIPALAIGEVWRRQESLLACVLLHSWFNASLLAVTLALAT